MIDPNCLGYLSGGTRLLRDGRDDRALQSFDKALALDPTLETEIRGLKAEAYLTRGRVLMQAGKLEEADSENDLPRPS